MVDKKRWIFKKHQEFKKQEIIINKTKPKTPHYLEKRTWKLASKYNFSPSKVVIKKLKSRWGSAGKTGIITINHELIKTPSRLIDYIIIHELCHLKIQNHSYRYWNLVRKYCPQYEKRKMELDNLGIL
jgi:predicted metal-dependent hydrolase